MQWRYDYGIQFFDIGDHKSSGSKTRPIFILWILHGAVKYPRWYWCPLSHSNSTHCACYGYRSTMHVLRSASAKLLYPNKTSANVAACTYNCQNIIPNDYANSIINSYLTYLWLEDNTPLVLWPTILVQIYIS